MLPAGQQSSPALIFRSQQEAHTYIYYIYIRMALRYAAVLTSTEVQRYVCLFFFFNPPPPSRTGASARFVHRFSHRIAVHSDEGIFSMQFRGAVRRISSSYVVCSAPAVHMRGAIASTEVLRNAISIGPRESRRYPGFKRRSDTEKSQMRDVATGSVM